MGKSGNRRAFNLSGNQLDCLEITLRGDRKACLDYMDADIGDLASDLKFLLESEGYSRGLFPIPERCVKNSYSLVCGVIDKEDDPPQNPCESYISCIGVRII